MFNNSQSQGLREYEKGAQKKTVCQVGAKINNLNNKRTIYSNVFQLTPKKVCFKSDHITKRQEAQNSQYCV